jgi:hypothetical protein
MASADGELFKDVFVVDGVDMHEVEDGAGGVKKTKEKKFDKGTLAAARVVIANVVVNVAVSNVSEQILRMFLASSLSN